MKKILSLVLSLTMVTAVTAGIDFSAYAYTYYESENNNSYSTADYVPVNSTIYGVCTDNHDEDWYKFTLDSPAKVNVNFSFNRADSSGHWNVCIYKYAGNGGYAVLDDKDVYLYDGSCTFSSLGLPAGTYFVKVVPYGAYGVQYSVTPKCTYTSNWEREFNDSYTTADALTFGSTRYGVCTDSSDVDWYKFTLTSSAKIKVNFTHNKSNRDGHWYVCIYKYTGSGGYAVLDNRDVYCSDGAYTFSGMGLSKGTYFVKVDPYGAYGIKYGVTVNYSVPAPSSLKVSSRGNTSLKLNWSKVSGASGYQLQRKSGNSWKNITTTSSNTATVSSLAAGRTYQFRVRAYKTVSGKKCYSSWRSLTACTKPKTVNLKSLSSQASGHAIKASWNKVGGTASGYQIYWAKDKNFNKVVAKTTVSGQSKTSYTGRNFTKGNRYYVKIRAYKTVNGKKYYGSWSNVKSVKAK